jgi:hypothetical protein
MERRRRSVVHTFAESIGQPREPAHRHAHGEVRGLHVQRGNVFRIRLTCYHLRRGAQALAENLPLFGCGLFPQTFASIA